MRPLVWFRTDLRVHDNPALYHASRVADRGVIAVFNLSPEQWREHDWGAMKVNFMLRNLAALAEAHPKNKRDVGRRLSLIALNKVYGFDNEYSGPVYKSYKIDGSKIIITFDFANGLNFNSEDKLKGFAIAGSDHKFYWADAVIDGGTVIVSCPLVSQPVAVRYAWASNPVCNLYNSAGLPASPFRTDNWEVLTKDFEK